MNAGTPGMISTHTPSLSVRISETSPVAGSALNRVRVRWSRLCAVNTRTGLPSGPLVQSTVGRYGRASRSHSIGVGSVRPSRRYSVAEGTGSTASRTSGLAVPAAG